MAEASRSLSACLRCRRQKLKCGGPSQVPCQRCRASKSECIFVRPRAILVKETRGSPAEATEANSADRVSQLEQRLISVESQLRAEIEELKASISTNLQGQGRSRNERSLSAAASSRGEMIPWNHITQLSTAAAHGGAADHSADIVSRGLVSEEDWNELYSFYWDECRTIVGFMDDQVYPPMHILRRHPLLSTVICSVAARAIKPELYLFLLSEADNLIKDSFQGPTPEFYSLIAMILVTAWCGRFRLWCYVISVASELKLNEAALQLGENDMQNTEEVMERARTWFTLCCFDLQLNLTRPFAMTRLKDYLPYAKALLTSPYCRPVDYRICALIEGFTIADSVKSQLRSSQLQAQPLSRAVCQLLTSFDDRTDEWFHKINNKIEPLYQTFGEQQDRNRFMIPYAYLKLYINGLAFHGLESAASNAPDASRLAFIRKALDSASLLIQTQFESDMFQAKLRYTIDYNGTTLIHASNFILKVIPLVYQHLDCQKYLASLRKAAQMFEQAGAQEAANEMRWEQENLLELTQTELSPEAYDDGIDATMEETEGLFDIPNFLNDMTWANDFPILSDYTLS